MSLTAIFSDMGDLDCQALVHLWDGFTDANVLHFTHSSTNTDKAIMNALMKEDDTLIMCGHGCPWGLFNPSMHGGSTLINENNAPFIHANRIVSLWCYAKRFGKSQHLPGFWSDMFISNPGEALANGISGTSHDKIYQGCVTYCHNVSELLHDNVPLSEWKPILVSKEDMSDPVNKFNYDGIEFLG